MGVPWSLSYNRDGFLLGRACSHQLTYASLLIFECAGDGVVMAQLVVGSGERYCKITEIGHTPPLHPTGGPKCREGSPAQFLLNGGPMQTIGSGFEARRQNGFTLIEMLIVTVIIGILAAIAVPKFSSAKEKAYDRAAMSDIRRAQVAAEAYYADNMAYPATEGDADFTPSSGVTFTRWQVETKDGVSSIHLHADHVQSTHYYHAHYPADAELELRNK